MTTAVVCDDDKVTRASVSALCEGAGLEVVAETDSGNDAVELVRRFGVDIVVLDLSLPDGSAETALTTLTGPELGATVVVFTTFHEDADRLVRMGAREVVQKPDFDRLRTVLTDAVAAVARATSPDERRRASREVELAPTLWRSPAGVSSHHDLAHSLLTVVPGDAVLAVTVVGLEQLEADVGPLLTADCRLAVAGVLRDELRVQDLLHEVPAIGGFVALIRGGDARSAGAVWSRLTAGVREMQLPGEVRGAAARVDAAGTRDALARTVAALQAASLSSPSFVSV